MTRHGGPGGPPESPLEGSPLAGPDPTPAVARASTPRHPATRIDPCAFCGRLRQGDELVHVRFLFPGRKRGWVCVEHTRPTRDEAREVARFALLREALGRGVPDGGDSKGASGGAPPEG